MDKAELKVEFLGECKAPLLIIDNGGSNLERLRRFAIEESQFSSDNISMYPGVRAPLPRDYVISVVQPLLPYLYQLYKIPRHLKPTPIDNYFSLMTKSESELSAVQTTPHFDKNSRYFLAILLYMNEGEFGGTGFFRHKNTGYEFVDDDRKELYCTDVEKYLLKNISVPPSYCNAQHPEFELYKSLDYKANRLAIYQGFMLHSTLVNLETYICASPASGRLTANIFLDFA